MTATAQPAFRFHRHFPGGSHGDTSFPPMILDRPRKAEEYVRRPSCSIQATATPRDMGSCISLSRTDAGSPVFTTVPVTLLFPGSPPRQSPSAIPTTSPTPSLRASMSFANTNATSTWGSSALSSSASSSPSPSTSRVRHEEREQRPVHTEKEASERKEEARSAGEDFRRGPLTNPEMFAPTARTPYSDVNPSSRASSASPPLSTSASSDRLQYSTRESWSPEYVRPMISKLVHPPEPVRPRYSEFLQGPSRPGFSATRRGDTASPPPSPSPSLTSFSARSPSVGFTDTEPTDEDEHLYIKREYENLELPPLRLPDSVVPTLPSLPSLTASHHRAIGPVQRASLARVQRTNAISPLSSGSPESPVRRSIKRDLNSFPVCESDVRTRIPFRSGELPQAPSRQPWAMQQHMVPSRGRPTMPQYARDAHEPDSEQVLLSPTPKKYRFVSSRPLLRVGPIPQEAVDGDSVDSPELVGGMKRRYPTASRESSVDAPPAGSPHDGPRKRGRQQPFSVGLFPASEAAARSVRGPRGAINPAYHHDTERSLKCAFPTCNVVLSGKKAETASHMRAHFVEVAGETLHCPWPMESEDGQHVRCGMAFKDSANFGRHVSSRHIKAEEYQCNRCGRPFSRRDAALRHMKTLCRPGGSGSKKKGRKKKVSSNVEDEEYMYHD
ncbi:hypothetical protein K466DRAFT_582403 [Polyporus arcularius HHB13444]|uniref:C2H2-type domain-containing protein n=1 Tax=Polyporus arcularius HHB13444 TaxID=1314778 RepID=A0A5C3Q0D8_9APHY|nr:hypothetical protein K466DRAFT_582403 [Polyporus arcularius HHB13444]